MAATLEFIDREISLENMVISRDILRKHGLEPFLHYGTALGAVREKDFIPHDDDVDFGLYGRDKETFLRAFPELEANGFTVLYIRDDGYLTTSEISDTAHNFRMYKMKRKDQEIDFFLAFEKKTIFGKRWDIDGRVTIPARFLDTLDTIDFLGETFSCPHDPVGFLRNMYGKTWNVPIRNTTSRIGWATRFRKLKNPLKVFFYARRFILEKMRKNRLKKEYERAGTK